MSTSNFSEALKYTINYWKELDIWEENKNILSKFLTLLSPPPKHSLQLELLSTLKVFHHPDSIISLEEIDTLIYIIKNAKSKNTSYFPYDIGVDYPIYYGIEHELISFKKSPNLKDQEKSELISLFISECYKNLKEIAYNESDEKIYRAILAIREIVRDRVIRENIAEEHLQFYKLPSNNLVDSYRANILAPSRDKKFSFWRCFKYEAVVPTTSNILSEVSKKKNDTNFEDKSKKETSNRSPVVKKKKKAAPPTKTTNHYVPRAVLSKKMSWKTAKIEVESAFDYSSLSLSSVLEFISFIRMTSPELSNMAVFCFLTGIPLDKAIYAVYLSKEQHYLTVPISNAPSNTKLPSHINLKLPPLVILNFENKTLESIESLTEDIFKKFGYLARQFAKLNSGHRLLIDRIAANSNRLLTPLCDDIRVHYLRANIGFSMSAPFSYIALSNEKIGELYKERFNKFSSILETSQSIDHLKWDSSLPDQVLGSKRLPKASVRLFFKKISALFYYKYEQYRLTPTAKQLIDVVNIMEVYTYLLEQLLMANRPSGKKSLTVYSDVLMRKDKNSAHYQEFKVVPIPELFSAQKRQLHKVRQDLLSFVFMNDKMVLSRDHYYIHQFSNDEHKTVKSPSHNEFVKLLNSFGIAEIPPSTNTFRHYSATELKFNSITSRAFLGHNEDGFYYPSPTSSTSISQIHEDVLSHQTAMIKRFGLGVLKYDRN
ncbi:hypothetical protein MSP8887_00572 [Marinomonas spartinae]|uniref:hypothetical protein n=1 Tax=Marinomonas spartinae TaxID=1792290 RepID=UPI0008090FA9|nr:hypothetical protein [Marinomonas spartinae]SBS27206.1 hypothetical protein MSP8887_00572 [Marinomonas spartinae]